MSLIPEHVIREIERKCNELPCDEGDGNQHVEIVYVGDVVVPRFSPDSPDSFKRAVHSLLKKELTRFLNGPFPLIK